MTKVSQHPLYGAYKQMKYRCTHPKSISYPNYGGRGIIVCDQWLESFENFLDDMGPRPEGAQLDRIDNDGPYCPENCRWSTPSENNLDKRSSRLLTFQGRTMTLTEWSEEVGIAMKTLHMRLTGYGWTVERTLSTPVRRRRG